MPAERERCSSTFSAPGGPHIFAVIVPSSPCGAADAAQPVRSRGQGVAPARCNRGKQGDGGQLYPLPCQPSRACALNLPNTCTALGNDLNQLISAYWETEPITDVHFIVEADRFCRFLLTRPELSLAAKTELEREHAIVAAKLAISRSLAKASNSELPA